MLKTPWPESRTHKERESFVFLISQNDKQGNTVLMEQIAHLIYVHYYLLHAAPAGKVQKLVITLKFTVRTKE